MPDLLVFFSGEYAKSVVAILYQVFRLVSFCALAMKIMEYSACRDYGTWSYYLAV